MAERNRSISLKPGKSRIALTITHPNAAGIDIGSASHFVAVPPDRDDEPVREFLSFTVDLNALADWLTACGVDTVAMESTGVYWIPWFELLESRGLTVLPVNARHVKNVSGRKSDVLNCQWLQQRMTYGLLSGTFRPTEQIGVLRSLWRQRGMLLRSQARHVQHMQKALTQMNVQLANVLSDVAGETGQKILRAIVAGERDGHVLGAMKNARIRASVDGIAKSLQGNWRAEHLFSLKQALDAFDFIGKQLAECDHEIEQQLQRLESHKGEPAKGKQRGRARHAPKFDLRTHLFKMCGVDLTRIDGIDVTTALAVISETGTDMSHFATMGHFTSGLGLCPGTKITGGKVMSGKTKRVANRAAQALRLAAAALRKPVGFGRVLPAHVLAHGQTKGRRRSCPQTSPADLHHADQGRAVHRPGPGLLPRALPRTCFVAPVPTRPEAGHAARRDRTTDTCLKTVFKISHLKDVS